MRVGVNARLLYSPELRGFNRYTVNLLSALAGLGHELFLYSDQPVHADHLARLPEGSYQVRVSPPKRYTFWEQRWLPKQCRLDKVDVLHTPFHFGLPYWSPCPRVLTWHDALEVIHAPPRQSLKEEWRNGRLMPRFHHWVARTRAEKILTVSEHVRADLIRLLQIPENKIQAIPEAADPHFGQTISGYRKLQVRRAHDLANPYFLYVGSWDTRKNLPFLVEAFAAAELEDIDLVLAGGQSHQKAELEKIADELGVADNVRLLGWIDEAELPALYSAALGFVYASEYEGFCLQLCEAMSMGCAVLAADSSSLAEVLGDGGEKFGLINPVLLGALMRRVFYDELFRANLQERARKRAAEFSWERTARDTVAVYESIQRVNRASEPVARVEYKVAEPEAIAKVEVPEPATNPIAIAMLEVSQPAPESAAIAQVGMPELASEPAATAKVEAPEQATEPETIAKVEVPQPAPEPAAIVKVEVPELASEPAAMAKVDVPEPATEPEAITKVELSQPAPEPTAIAKVDVPEPASEPKA